MSAEADQIRRDRLERNMALVEGCLAQIRADLEAGKVFHVATGADELARCASMVQAAANVILRNTPWPGAPAIQARAKQEAAR